MSFDIAEMNVPLAGVGRRLPRDEKPAYLMRSRLGLAVS
jgi:hypothetical protein